MPRQGGTDTDIGSSYEMSTQTELILLELRKLIMQGKFAAGESLMEVPLAKLLKTSRTPVRLALGTLAQEGLLVYTPQKGFLLRAFSTKEIIDAVEVRARLDGLACRLVAEQGLQAREEALLDDNIAATRELTRVGQFPADLNRWCDLNDRFHNLFVEASANQTLTRLVKRFDSTPFASAKIAAATGKIHLIPETVATSLTMHSMILGAVKKRQADRADQLMQEHIYQGRVRLTAYLEKVAVVSPFAGSSLVELSPERTAGRHRRLRP